jgi:DNA polymerase-4
MLFSIHQKNWSVVMPAQLATSQLPPRAILHLDGDAFFASLEQRDDPKLRGKPVAVGTGVVASCSYEARRDGVRTGMRLTEARWRCRDLIVVPGEYPRYEQAARRMQAICQERTPLVEVAALDDLYLDLSPFHECVSLEQVARDLRAQINEEVRLSVSIGMGSNKLIAKVATKQAKPGREVVVAAGTEREYLAPWPARVLPGAGRKIADRLEQLNVQRVKEVAVMPVPVLRGLFGNQGRLLHQQAHGIDLRPVEPRKPPQSVSRRTSFDPPRGDPEFLRAMLDYLVERAVSWLHFQGLAAKRTEVTIRYGDYETATGHASFSRPADEIRDLQGVVRDCFDRLYQRRLPLRLLGVTLAPLVPPDRQLTLIPGFTDEARTTCGRRLAECKDAIRRRFGFTALLNGSALLLANHLERDRENFRMRTPCLTR